MKNEESSQQARSDAIYWRAGLAVAAGLLILSLTAAPPFLGPDDMFYGAWAGHYGKTGHMWTPVLSRTYPGRDEILIYPPLHFVVAGLFFRSFGFTAAIADVYTSLCAFLTSIGCMLVMIRLGLTRAALAAAPIGFLIFAFAGLRPEVTAAPLFAIGLAFVLGNSRAETMLGRVLMFTAPVAGPSILGPAAALLAMLTLWDMYARRTLTPLLDSAAALAIAVFLLGLPIGFRYAEILQQVSANYTTQSSSVDAHPFVKAVVLAAAAFVVSKRGGDVRRTIILLALGVGTLIAMIHTSGATTMLVTYVAIGIFVGAMAQNTRWEALSMLGLIALAMMLYGSLPMFWLTTKPNLASDAETKKLVAQLSQENRNILVDGVAGKYLYNYEIEDKLSWRWSKPSPDWSVPSLSDLHAGDIWVLSRFSLLGYFRGETSLSKYLNLAGVPYKMARLPRCPLGRISCGLPARRFDYVLFWRDKLGQAYIQDLVADPTPRPIS